MFRKTAVGSEDMLVCLLEAIWHEVSDTHDVASPMPDISTLFAGVSLTRPYDAAETILVNILTEITERVDRFSPWYTRPAADYGLTAQRRTPTGALRWRLTEEGYQKWWHLLDNLAPILEQNRSLVEAMILVDRLMSSDQADDMRVSVRCRCRPPRLIQVRQSILDQAQILCNVCHHSFEREE